MASEVFSNLLPQSGDTLRILEAKILTVLVNGGGGGGGGGGAAGSCGPTFSQNPPSGVPACSNMLWLRTTTGNIWYWDSDPGPSQNTWVQVL